MHHLPLATKRVWQNLSPVSLHCVGHTQTYCQGVAGEIRCFQFFYDQTYLNLIFVNYVLNSLCFPNNLQGQSYKALQVLGEPLWFWSNLQFDTEDHSNHWTQRAQV